MTSTYDEYHLQHPGYPSATIMKVANYTFTEFYLVALRPLRNWSLTGQRFLSIHHNSLRIVMIADIFNLLHLVLLGFTESEPNESCYLVWLCSSKTLQIESDHFTWFFFLSVFRMSAATKKKTTEAALAIFRAITDRIQTEGQSFNKNRSRQRRAIVSNMIFLFQYDFSAKKKTWTTADWSQIWLNFLKLVLNLWKAVLLELLFIWTLSAIASKLTL